MSPKQNPSSHKKCSSLLISLFHDYCNILKWSSGIASIDVPVSMIAKTYGLSSLENLSNISVP